MLLGYNPLEYYESKALQRWLTADNKDVVAVYETKKIPAFILISDTSQSSATVQVFNAEDDSPIDSSDTVTVTASDSNKELKYAGSTISPAQNEGYYYLKIITNGSAETYYSEVFGWKDDPSDLLKITAVSADILLADTYQINMALPLTFESYLYAEEAETDADIFEEGVEKPYGDIPVFNMLNKVNSFEVYGTRAIFLYLAGLRVLKTNGTVTFVYNGVSMSAYDITAEKKESTAFDEVVIITLKFKEENYISSLNDI